MPHHQVVSVDAEGPAPVHVLFGEERETFFAEELQCGGVSAAEIVATPDVSEPGYIHWAAPVNGTMTYWTGEYVPMSALGLSRENWADALRGKKVRFTIEIV